MRPFFLRNVVFVQTCVVDEAAGEGVGFPWGSRSCAHRGRGGSAKEIRRIDSPPTEGERSEDPVPGGLRPSVVGGGREVGRICVHRRCGFISL